LERGAPAEAGALRAATSTLDRASSISDAGLAAADAVIGLLARMRDEGAQTPEALSDLLDRIGQAVAAAEFDGVNLLGGETPGGALKTASDAGGGEELVLRAYDFRAGGPVVAVDAGADLSAVSAQVEASLARAEAARTDLGEDAKRVEAHRAFVGLLSDAVAGSGQGLDVDGARLTALSIRQTIGGTTLTLSNAAPQSVLSLFR
jgi:flagellin